MSLTDYVDQIVNDVTIAVCERMIEAFEYSNNNGVYKEGEDLISQAKGEQLNES